MKGGMVMAIVLISAIILVLLGIAAVFLFRAGGLEDDEDSPRTYLVEVRSIEQGMIHCEVMKVHMVVMQEYWFFRPHIKAVPEGNVAEETRHLLKVGAQGCLHTDRDYMRLELFPTEPLTKEQRFEQVRKARRKRLGLE